jgi:hypothetical protein
VRESTKFCDIPTGSAFYDSTGAEWRKADGSWAVRVGDGATMPFVADAIFETTASTHTQKEE